MSTKDYRVEVRVRNNWLLKKIEEEGYETLADFCRKCGIHAAHVSAFVTFRNPAKNSKGEWNTQFLRIANALRCMPEDICPPQHHDKALKKNKSVFEADVKDIAGYLTGNAETARPAIERIIEDERDFVVSQIITKRLTPREERILRMRYGLTDDGNEKTLKEVANIFGVHRELIRQIEAKALKKLRNPHYSRILRDYNEEAARTSFSPNRHYVPEWKLIENMKEKKQ